MVDFHAVDGEPMAQAVKIGDWGRNSYDMKYTFG